MKLLILFFSFLIPFQSLDLDTVRKDYKEAAQDKTQVEAFHKSLSKVTKNDTAELVAYKGAAITLMAKYTMGLLKKKEGFIEGVTLVDYAIEKDPKSIEARFVRLGIQENTPKFLKYKANIEEDKNFILKNFQNITSESLKNHIKDYISQSKAFTDEEKSVILAPK